MKRFGEKVRALRQRDGLTLQQLSDMLDISTTHIWNIEHGKKTANAAMILKFADVFGVTTDQLMRDGLEVE